MKLSNYYFTFGTDERYPYYGGWLVIEAESMNRAVDIFKTLYPSTTEWILACDGCYTEAQFERTGLAKTGHYGEYCHEVIRRESI